MTASTGRREGRQYPKTSRVSADGRILVFRSQLKLTGYDNQGTSEFYRYDAESGQITCITCNPTGAAAGRQAPELKNPDMYHAPSSHAAAEAQPFLSRNLSPDGNRFFFQSTDKLVPADVNGEPTCPPGTRNNRCSVQGPVLPRRLRVGGARHARRQLHHHFRRL